MAPGNQDCWRIESQSLLWLLWCAFQMNAWARTGMKGKKPSTYAFRISLSMFRRFLKANKDTSKSSTIKTLEKKKRDKNCKTMCSVHLFTNCGEHRRLCGLCYHCLQLWLGCQWGIWGAGWGRQEGLGAVIKLPLFPPDSLQGSNSALIG